MSIAAFSSRAASCPTLSVALLILGSILGIAREGHARLDSNLLSQSRGRNPNSAVYIGNCSTINGYPICYATGMPCTMCTLSQFDFTGPIDPPVGPGYTTSTAAQLCGVVQNGYCDKGSAGLTCTGQWSKKACSPPPNAPEAQ